MWVPLIGTGILYNRLFRAKLGMRTAGIEGRKTAKELAAAEGFEVEDHHAVTEDGFVLVLHRILNPALVSVAPLSVQVPGRNCGVFIDQGCLFCVGTTYRANAILSVAFLLLVLLLIQPCIAFNSIFLLMLCCNVLQPLLLSHFPVTFFIRCFFFFYSAHCR